MKEQQILEAVKTHLGVGDLNAMQRAVLRAWPRGGDMVVYSPTGTGKTLAYAIPVLKSMMPACGQLQAVVIVPSRELAMQVGSVMRSIATDYKVSLCYGGHDSRDEKASLSVVPDIIVATPGRLLDHITRRRVDVGGTRLLVLDEFDKSLELGFEEEMQSIIAKMNKLSRRILTSATEIAEMPNYLRLNQPNVLNFVEGAQQSQRRRLSTWLVRSHEPDKLLTLLRLLYVLPDGKTIVFVNYRDAARRVYDFLREKHVSAGIYHGELDQVEREKAVALLANGSFQVMVSTDLGARGLDIEDVKHIIHYHLPTSPEAFTHRNGRTARVEATGDAYVILGPNETLPEWIAIDNEFGIPADVKPRKIVAPMATLHFSAGRKEKISRGDIVGFIANNSHVQASEIGKIDVNDHYALVAVPAHKAAEAIADLNREKIKGRKVRISLARIKS